MLFRFQTMCRGKKHTWCDIVNYVARSPRYVSWIPADVVLSPVYVSFNLDYVHLSLGHVVLSLDYVPQAQGYIPWSLEYIVLNDAEAPFVRVLVTGNSPLMGEAERWEPINNQHKQTQMAFKKREQSLAVKAAQVRLSAMKTIDQAQGAVVNYGTAKSPCSSTTISAQCVKIEADTDKYNSLLAQADELANSLAGAEAVLKDDIARVLLGARAQFGRDSSEVEQLGGTRTSERAKRTPTPAPTPAK